MTLNLGEEITASFPDSVVCSLAMHQSAFSR